MTQPAPFLGLDTVSPLAQMDPNAAVQMDNFISQAGGVRLRTGWYEYATGLPSAIKTVFSWNGAPLNAVSPPSITSTLFCSTDEGIYEIPVAGDYSAAVPDVDLLGIQNAGRLSYVMFNTGFQNYLVVASEAGGVWIYDGTAWTKMVQGGAPGVGVIEGVNPDDFCFVMAWKERLWFIRQNSTEAWYLPIQSVGGTAEYVDFGPSFTHGGQLLALISWTQDAGKGLDDHLVVLSSAGDMAVFQGTDPSTVETFGMIGTWFIGQPPIGRRCFTETGGTPFILTERGLLSASDLVQGGLQTANTSNTAQSAGLRRIQNALQQDFSTLLNTDGWEVRNVRTESVMILRPQTTVDGYEQYLWTTHTMAWAILRDIPIRTFGSRLDAFYGGTEDGRVLRLFDGSTDGRKLDGSGETEIRGRVTPAFSYYGDVATVKHAVMARADFLAEVNPAYIIRIMADFTLRGDEGSPIAVPTIASRWDDAFWDQGNWAGGPVAFGEWRTVGVIGRALAPSLFVSASRPTVLVSVTLMGKPGGPL